jgi:hypothetical protein
LVLEGFAEEGVDVAGFQAVLDVVAEDGEIGVCGQDQFVVLGESADVRVFYEAFPFEGFAEGLFELLFDGGFDG